jgi:putative tryptophan/tyrosine transport system substrate-binding protein
MRRREVVAAVAAAGAWSLGALAQQRTKFAMVGYLSGVSPHHGARAVEAFRRRLEELGYLEGQSISFEQRWAEGHRDRLPLLAAELVKLRVDVIVAVSTASVLAAKNATATIPIVMINVGDPVALGLVDSLSRPSGNVTGRSFTVGAETFEKGLELLTEAIPDLRLVGVLSSAENPAHPIVIEKINGAAKAVRLNLKLLAVRTPDEFDSAFEAMVSAGAGAVLVVGDPLFTAYGGPLAQVALRNRLPSMHQLRQDVEMGGLMAYGPEQTDHWVRAADYVHKLLKGAKPGDLPVEQPTKFELVINLRTAKALGLTIPPTLLARADEVIE